MKTLQLSLLGGFEARVSGHRVELRSNKAKALLAYLALSRGRSRSRAELLALLWSDRSEEQARRSLRQELSVLRRALGDDAPLIIDHETVSLDSTHVENDVMVLDRLANGDWGGERLDPSLPPQGELLSGLVIRDRAFDEWLTVEQNRVQTLAITAHARLLARQREAGLHNAARGTATNLLGLDPFNENAHRALMEAYAARGERSVALTQYETLRTQLSEELGVTPERETERLYHTIREQIGGSQHSSAETVGTSVMTNILAVPDDEKPRYARRSYAPDRNWFGAISTSLVVVGGAVAFLLWSAWQERERYFAEEVLVLEAELEQSELKKRHLAAEAELVTVRLKAEAEALRHSETTKRAELERALAKLEKQLAAKQAELRRLNDAHRQEEIERKLELERMRAQEAEREAKVNQQIMALEVEQVSLARTRLELEAARVSAEAEKQAELERLQAEEAARQTELERERQALVTAWQTIAAERARAKAKRAEAMARIRAEEAAKREALERERDELILERAELLRQLAQLDPQFANADLYVSPTVEAEPSTEPANELAALEAWRRAEATIQQTHSDMVKPEIEQKRVSERAESAPRNLPEESSNSSGQKTANVITAADNLAPAAHRLQPPLDPKHGTRLHQSPPYRVALLPYSYSGGNRPRIVEDSVHDFVNRNKSFELVYSYYLPEYRTTTASMQSFEDVWVGPVLRRHPRDARVRELGERLGAELVILHRIRNIQQELEEQHAHVQSFLLDVVSGETYQANGTLSNSHRITAQVFSNFLESRDYLSEADDAAKVAKIE